MAGRWAVVLSGGAPNGALMAGALWGIYNKGYTFHEFHTSGAGAAYGLAFVGGKNAAPDVALRSMLKVGIDDSIYAWLPLGFKTFFKSGPFTVPLKKLSENFKHPAPSTPAQRFYNDWVDLWTAAITPTTVNYSSEGLCAHYPFLSDTIDFTKANAFRGDFSMNAYCIEDKEMVEFDKAKGLAPEHFFAALSYPFIYPPTEIAGKHYYEGSALEPLNLPLTAAADPFGPRKHDKTHLGRVAAKAGQAGGPTNVVIIDVLGPLQEALIRLPRHIVDAYGISIMTPVVSLAVMQRELFLERNPNFKNKVKALQFNVPVSAYPTLTDWSASNLDSLFEIGVQAGTKFAQDHGSKAGDGGGPNGLPVHLPNSPDF